MILVVSGLSPRKVHGYERSRQVSTVDGGFGRSSGRDGSSRRRSSLLRPNGRHDDLPNQRQCVDQGGAGDSGAPRWSESNSVANGSSWSESNSVANWWSSNLWWSPIVGAEGLNSRIQASKVSASGYRNREHFKTASYFHFGGLQLYPTAP